MKNLFVNYVIMPETNPLSNERFEASVEEKITKSQEELKKLREKTENSIKNTSKLREKNNKKEDNKADERLDEMLDSELYTDGNSQPGETESGGTQSGGIEGLEPNGNGKPREIPEVGEGQTSPGGIEGPEPDGNSQPGETESGGPQSGGIEGPEPNGNGKPREIPEVGEGQTGGMVGGRGDLQEKISKNGETGKIAQEIKEDDLFSSLFNELSDSAVVYSVDGVNINVHKGSDENGNFVQIEKLGREGGDIIVTDYRLCKNSDGGYSLKILKDKNVVDQMDNLTKEELINKVLPNFRNRINEGRDIMNKQREEKMKNFDLYASIGDQSFDGKGNVLNNLV